MPAVRCFRDIDDLEKISELEMYVEQSAVVLLFASKNYFYSRNCVRLVESNPRS